MASFFIPSDVQIFFFPSDGSEMLDAPNHTHVNPKFGASLCNGPPFKAGYLKRRFDFVCTTGQGFYLEVYCFETFPGRHSKVKRVMITMHHS
jgi:hypothetical protein